jgi:hypothetical protein
MQSVAWRFAVRLIFVNKNRSIGGWLRKGFCRYSVNCSELRLRQTALFFCNIRSHTLSISSSVNCWVDIALTGFYEENAECKK